MSWITTITADQIMLSLLAICAIRIGLITFLPDEVAGPGGWLVDTEAKS